jgi:hypothetical protein
LKKFVEIMTLTIALWIGVVSMVWLAILNEQTNWDTKSCELAEISPDFTPQEKADCRIARKK